MSFTVSEQYQFVITVNPCDRLRFVLDAAGMMVPPWVGRWFDPPTGPPRAQVWPHRRVGDYQKPVVAECTGSFDAILTARLLTAGCP